MIHLSCSLVISSSSFSYAASTRSNCPSSARASLLLRRRTASKNYSPAACTFCARRCSARHSPQFFCRAAAVRRKAYFSAFNLNAVERTLLDETDKLFEDCFFALLIERRPTENAG